MKLITFEDIMSLKISPEQCYEWAEYMIRNKKTAILPPKISIKPYEGVFCNVMPSIVYDDTLKAWVGVKTVTRYPDRVPSIVSSIQLLDANTGENLALMDGTWITAMRTGAVAAHTILLLAKKEFSVIGLMGLGNVARATLLVLLSKLTQRHITIKLLKYHGQENEFIKRFSGYENVSFATVDSVSDMVKGSDVIISGATYLSYDICEDKYFDEGVLVVPIHTRGFTNCDLFFDKVFADDDGHVCDFKNYSKFNHFAEVCDVLNGTSAGRENDKERIIAYNIGISIHDIYFASRVYLEIQRKNAYQSLPVFDMKTPNSKYWV